MFLRFRGGQIADEAEVPVREEGGGGAAAEDVRGFDRPRPAEHDVGDRTREDGAAVVAEGDIQEAAHRQDEVCERQFGGRADEENEEGVDSDDGQTLSRRQIVKLNCVLFVF